ncbi:TlpA family protein disulfide reductase [Arcticibacter tournemirensis]|uniref:TlpA family protein disulfide reductase n=2 Tax=Arcticibacter tournemirensis TaxID=699437 RepID=A0A4Q0MCH0_9SPHI|nr:TlpA family protein disulfide reductase [Arcticibacter tournemirensis]
MHELSFQIYYIRILNSYSMTKPFLLLFCLIISLNLSAQKLNLETGNTFAFIRHSAMKTPYKSDSEFTYNFKVLGKDNEGKYRLECVLQRIWQKEPSYGRVGEFTVFNSDSIHKTTLQSSGLLIPFSILGKPFEVVLDSLGRVDTVEGLEQLVNNSLDIWQAKDELRAQCIQNLKATPRVEIEGLFRPLSEKKIAYPGSWTSEDKQTQYNVTGKKGALLMIRQSSSKEDTTYSVQKGDIVLNSNTGLKESSQIYYSLSPKVKNGPSEEIETSETIKLVKPVRIKAVDTAWINMAVRISWMSTWLKSGDEDDSLKVFNAFKKYDPIFRGDAYYVSTKLSLMQHFRSDRAYRNYSKELAKTPNHLLESQYSHLFNKLQKVADKSADSAYAIAQYMSKTPSFSDWVHNSFAQDFLRDRYQKPSEEEMRNFAEHVKKLGWTDEEIAEEQKNRLNSSEQSYILLDKLNNSNNPAMRKTAHPLYLWVTSKDNSKDKSVLMKAATEFGKMSPADLQTGNGGRYALLIYDLLQRAGESKTAVGLLDGTINQLDGLVKDSLNTERYAQQNILAFAYYLKYKETAATDSAKAFRYLSRAAELSPKSEKESAYASSYDRVFLHSKESYRGEYLAELFKKGDRSSVLPFIIEHINANPNQLGEMKKTYEGHFPGESFNRFFAEKIITSWSPAPDFRLKGIDGKEHALKDYKGKWLMLDFWGTWCGPCCQEMPSINSFAKEVEEGKHKNVSFLSIACHDTEEKVKSFFTKNNYAMPAVMSDNIIEKNYNVRGYPSKVIISPEGRMLTVNFGTDWKDVVMQFSKIQE